MLNTQQAKFPYEKAKVLAAESIRSDRGIIATAIGYHNEGDGKVTIYLLGNDGSRWVREFILLNTETSEKWFMVIGPYGGVDARFRVLE